jgi:hypothetical protein
VPLWIAFALGRRAANRRYTYGYGRAEDLAGLFIVAMIALSAVLAGVQGIRRLLDPAPVEHLSWVALSSPTRGSASGIPACREVSAGGAGRTTPRPRSFTSAALRRRPRLRVRPDDLDVDVDVEGVHVHAVLDGVDQPRSWWTSRSRAWASSRVSSRITCRCTPPTAPRASRHAGVHAVAGMNGCRHDPGDETAIAPANR